MGRVDEGLREEDTAQSPGSAGHGNCTQHARRSHARHHRIDHDAKSHRRELGAICRIYKMVGTKPGGIRLLEATDAGSSQTPEESHLQFEHRLKTWGHCWENCVAVKRTLSYL